MPAHYQTAHLMAYQLMIPIATLLNDPSQTDYTNEVMFPFLNMAITELNEHLMESNVALSNQTVLLPVRNDLVGMTDLITNPIGLVEVQAVSERPLGSNGSFNLLPRKEFIEYYPKTNSLVYWCWMDQRIRFNPNGVSQPMEIKLDYVSSPINVALFPESIIGPGGSSPYLIYKTASLCALFIGENPTRSQELNQLASEALERIVSISNKGKQEIMTRHRPFRARYKMGGY